MMILGRRLVLLVCPSRTLPELNAKQKIHQTTSLKLPLCLTLATGTTASSHSLPLALSVSPYVCTKSSRFLVSAPVVRHASTSSIGDDDQPWYDVDTDELVTMIQKNKGDMLLVDVRAPEELQQTGVIPGSINIPLEEVEEAFCMSPDDFDISYGVEKPSTDNPDVIFTCLTGIRSLVATSIAHQLGYSRARHYKRGWLGWEEHLEQVKNLDKNT